MQLKTSLNMADDIMTECMFTVGSCVSIITCFNETIEGEVIAFDYNKKLLILKSVGSNGQGGINDVHWINLDLVKNVSVKKEVKKEDVISNQLPTINTNRIDQRAKDAIDERIKLSELVNSGVSLDGIKLYLSLSKKIDGPVSWANDSIIIMNIVKISPPYKSNNLTIVSQNSNRTRAQLDDHLKYTRQLVEKFWSDQQNNKPSNANANDKPQLNNKG